MEGQIHFVIAAFSVQVQGVIFSVQQALPAQIMPADLPDSHTQRSNKRSHSKRQFLLVIVIDVTMTMMNCSTRFVMLVGWLFFFSWQVSLSLSNSSIGYCLHFAIVPDQHWLDKSTISDLETGFGSSVHCHFLWKTAKESTRQSHRHSTKIQEYRAVVVPTLLYSAVSLSLLEADEATLAISPALLALYPWLQLW